MRPFRFGITAHITASADEWLGLSRKVESLGFSTLLVPDHLGAQLAPGPALAVAAAATTTLRVGTLVTCNDFRHPVVQAKELATLDVLSGGRTEWGIGAGWLEQEYTAAGLRFDASIARVERLDEAVGVMKGLLGEDPVTHQGANYEIAALDGMPKPLQRPHPPLLIGGAGERILTLAARQADIIGVAPSLSARRVSDVAPSVSVEAAADRQLGWIKDASGERFDNLELNMVAYPAIVTDRPQEAADLWADPLGYTPAETLASPHVLIGSVAEICDSLEARRDRWGVSYWVVAHHDVDAIAPVVDRLAGV